MVNSVLAWLDNLNSSAGIRHKLMSTFDHRMKGWHKNARYSEVTLRIFVFQNTGSIVIFSVVDVTWEACTRFMYFAEMAKPFKTYSQRLFAE